MGRRFVCCACVALLLGCARERGAVFHVLDGGAEELLALDASALVLAREPSPGAELLALDDEALWLAGAGEAGGRLERRALSAAGAEPGRALAFRAPRVLAPGPDGSLFLLDGEHGERQRLWRVEPWLATCFLGEFAGGTALVWDGAALVFGSESGALLRLRRDGAVLAAVELGAPIVALLAQAEGEGGFALLGAPTPRLVRFERALGTRWSVGLSGPASALAADGEHSWLVEGDRLVRHDPRGARELELELPLRGGPWRTFAAAGGRVWLSGRGAVLELDSAGDRAWIVRAQGGFEALSAAARRRAGAAPRRAGSCRRGRPRARAPAPS